MTDDIAAAVEEFDEAETDPELAWELLLDLFREFQVAYARAERVAPADVAHETEALAARTRQMVEALEDLDPTIEELELWYESGDPYDAGLEPLTVEEQAAVDASAATLEGSIRSTCAQA